MIDYEQAYRDLRVTIKTLAYDMHRGWKHVGDGADAAVLIDKVLDDLASSAPTTVSEGATCGKCEWDGYGPNGCEHTTGVTSSDGDRGLGEAERADLSEALWPGDPVAAETGFAQLVMADLIAVVERILAARTAQPEGVERVEWEYAFGQKLRRRAPGPWEVVGDE